MDDRDFIPLLEQVKDLLLLGECFAFDDEENDAEIVIEEIDDIREQLVSGDEDARECLQQLFYPAGLLHMMALDNGWSEIYDEMAALLGVDVEENAFI